jgi:DedD protein
MERKLKERLVGAAVLVIVGVLVIPLLLDGPEHTSPVSVGLDLPATAGNQTRTHTIHLGTDAKPRTTPSSGTISRPARPAGASSTSRPEPSATSAGKQETQAEKTRAPAPVVEAEPLPTEARSVEPATVETKSVQEPVATAQAATPKDGWSVQIGAFGSKSNVVNLRKNLEAAGFETFVVPLERNGRILDAVRVGPVNTLEQARELAALLKKEGHSAAVVRNDL